MKGISDWGAGPRLNVSGLAEMVERLSSRKRTTLNQEQIKQIIPHREPFLFLDRITEIGDEFIAAEKTITTEDCQGHFSPPNFIFPGHLASEALVQAAACLVLFRYPELKNKAVALAKSESVFRLPIFPGDKIEIVVCLKREMNREKIGRFFFFSGEILKKNCAVVEWKGLGKYF